MSEVLEKNISWEDVKNDPNAIKVLDDGFIVLKETMGSDASIAESARVSYGKGTKTAGDDRNLLRYMMRHSHSSPYEQGELRFLIRAPIFVVRQWIRHRTANVNEISGRYSEMPTDFYTPPEWRGQSSTNKQGSEGIIDYDPEDFLPKESFDASLYTAEEVCFMEYERRLNSGVSRELARSCLPLSTYTIFYWKCDLHNIMNFLRLRMDNHAQEEIRVFAQAMYKLVKQKFPISMEAFDDYKLNAHNFSKMDLSLLKSILGKNFYNVHIEEKAKELGMSKREIVEFLNKLQ